MHLLTKTINTMEYSKIISVTGMPGLYELISSKGDGAVVRSLEDKSTKFASSRVHNFSHLESIEIFTVRENINLVDLFEAMEKASEKMPDPKDNSALRKYFERVYPDMDFERVYASDMKKIVKWFEILKANDIEIKLSEPEPEEEQEVVEEKAPAREEKAAKPAKEAPAKEKKPAAKKAAPKAKEKEEKEDKSEKPKAKKTATKAAKKK